jgi:hypothetical protein
MAAIDPYCTKRSPLGNQDREAILLRYFQDKSLKEVGRELGTSENAAQMRVSRAIEKLKRFLQKTSYRAVALFPLCCPSTRHPGHRPPALGQSATCCSELRRAAQHRQVPL